MFNTFVLSSKTKVKRLWTYAVNFSSFVSLWERNSIVCIGQARGGVSNRGRFL